MLGDRGIDPEIGYRGRYARQLGAEGERQAHQRRVPGEIGRRAGFADHSLDAEDAGEQAAQGVGRAEDDATVARGDQRRIADELQRVAKTLFDMQQDAGTVQILAAPLRHAEIPPRDTEGVRAPAPLVFAPALGIVPAVQPHHAEMEMRIRIVRIRRDGAAIAVFRTREIAQIVKRGAKITVQHGMARRQSQRATIAVDGGGNLALLMQRVAEIARRLVKIRRQFQRPPMCGCRLAEATLRAVDEAAAVMEIRGARFARDGLVDESQRRIDVAALICQHAGEMKGLGMIGRLGQDHSAQRRRFIGPAAFLKLHRLVERLPQRGHAAPAQ